MQPAAEDDCVHPIDANRDGMITCACAPGAMTACMTGLKAECAAGLATCKADSSGYGDCVPGVTPTAKPNGDQVISTLVLDGSSKLDATFNSLRGKSFNVNAKALRFDGLDESTRLRGNGHRERELRNRPADGSLGGERRSRARQAPALTVAPAHLRAR